MPGRAKAFAEKHKIPAAYEDTRAMLRRETLDGVSVVTTDRAHAEAALLAIGRGVNVMCEKPLAETMEDNRAVRKAVRENRRIVQIGSQRRSGGAGRL